MLQAARELGNDVGSVKLKTVQCVNCREVRIRAEFRYTNGGHVFNAPDETLFPQSVTRPPVEFFHCPSEVDGAYKDACLLRPIHIGACGAYVRRALELILDELGYAAKSLADSIKIVAEETNPDKRLKRNLLARLHYVKEIGNFALHNRRDSDLAIIIIDENEVDACLETIEELIQECFEEPAADAVRIEALNEKLTAAGKPTIKLD